MIDGSKRIVVEARKHRPAVDHGVRNFALEALIEA